MFRAACWLLSNGRNVPFACQTSHCCLLFLVASAREVLLNLAALRAHALKKKAARGSTAGAKDGSKHGKRSTRAPPKRKSELRREIYESNAAMTGAELAEAVRSLLVDHMLPRLPREATEDRDDFRVYRFYTAEVGVVAKYTKLWLSKQDAFTTYFPQQYGSSIMKLTQLIPPQNRSYRGQAVHMPYYSKSRRN